MKRKKRWLTMIICLLALLTNISYSFAQEGKPEAKPKKVDTKVAKVATNGTFKFFASKFIPGKLVKGAPYSATAITEHIQTLGDGNQIIRKNEATIYRDSEGRTRVDQKLETIGKWTADGDAPQMTYINDPVAGYSYNLDARTRTAYKGANTKAKAFKRALEMGKLKGGNPDAQGGKRIEKNPASPDDSISKSKIGAGRKEISTPDVRKKIESLGKKTIEGVEAEGSRSTLTIPAGEIGNTLPIEVADENWYSHELQVVVMSKHRDPRSGETTYRLTNINRSEPDRSLFEVPADYTVGDQSELKKRMTRESELKKKLGRP
jgi:hypothetical protein